MLLYIQGKKDIGKNYIIKILQIGFGLLQKQNKLIIAAFTKCAAQGIGKNTIHMVLNINI